MFVCMYKTKRKEKEENKRVRSWFWWLKHQAQSFLKNRINIYNLIDNHEITATNTRTLEYEISTLKSYKFKSLGWEKYDL